ncbi:MAG: M28 family metallopeptidase [Marinilabiliales bacterium]|nr:M28 family metallopeptidase [Marinilabiliales bacterium]
MYRILLLVALGWIAPYSLLGQTSDQGIRNAFHSISSHEMLDNAKELTSPKYGGRLSGSPGYMAAAKWVAEKLKAAGVKPACPDSGYLQLFPNAYSEVLSAGSVELLKDHQTQGRKYRFPDDFFPGSNSAAGKVKGDLVYAGYGISAPELGYDDYKNLNVKGKILLLESGVPYGANDSLQKRWEPYSYHRYKFSHAKEMGAVGLLYVGRVANPNTSFVEKFVYAHVGEEVAEELFKGSGKTYAEMKKEIAQKMQPASFDLKKRVMIQAHTVFHPEGTSCNVVGMIEGSDPVLKKEALIIGAHLDAVGSPGTLFPGALDNASGSCDILAAAEALARSAVRPARSVIFIFFGGEECGLYGSKLFVQSPVWPAQKVKCMINLDMVGNGRGFVLANGKSYPELLSHFKMANDQFLFRDFAATEVRKNYGRPRTDGAIFESAGYKTIHLYTSGTVKTVYYHHPLDNTDGLTPEIMEDAAKLLYLGILGIANDRSL